MFVSVISLPSGKVPAASSTQWSPSRCQSASPTPPGHRPFGDRRVAREETHRHFADPGGHLGGPGEVLEEPLLDRLPTACLGALQSLILSLRRPVRGERRRVASSEGLYECRQ